MGMDYGWEKLYQAVDALATGEGILKDRLHAAGIILIRLKPDEDIPADLRSRFTEVMWQLTVMPAQGDEGDIRASVDRLDSWQATRLARMILELYAEMNQRRV